MWLRLKTRSTTGWLYPHCSEWEQRAEFCCPYSVLFPNTHWTLPMQPNSGSYIPAPTAPRSHSDFFWLGWDRCFRWGYKMLYMHTWKAWAMSTTSICLDVQCHTSILLWDLVLATVPSPVSLWLRSQVWWRIWATVVFKLYFVLRCVSCLSAPKEDPSWLIAIRKHRSKNSIINHNIKWGAALRWRLTQPTLTSSSSVSFPECDREWGGHLFQRWEL